MNENLLTRFWKNPWTWISAAALIQLYVLPNGYLGLEHDDALYALATQALSQGHYRFWYQPGQPPITTLTPGYPLLLLPFHLLSSGRENIYPFANWLFLVAADVLAWLWLKKRQSAPIALLLTLLFALNPLVLSRAGRVMPEVAFLACVLAVLLLWEKPGWPAWATGLGLLACWMIRPAAWPLLAAFWLVFALRKNWRSLFACVVVPLSGIGLWTHWAHRAGRIAAESGELLDTYGRAGLGDLLSVAWTNAGQMAHQLGASFLPASFSETFLALLIGGALIGLCLWGLRKKLLKGWEPAGLFLLGSFLMHLLWPWWFPRYWLPLLPFLAGYAMEGYSSSRSGQPSRKVPAVLISILVLQFLLKGSPLLTEEKNALPEELRDSYAWIAQNTPSDTLFCSVFSGRDTVQTGRAFLPMPKTEDPAVFLRYLDERDVRYVFWTEPRGLSFSNKDLDFMTRLLTKEKRVLEDPSVFTAVYKDPTRGIRIFEKKHKPSRHETR